MTAHRLPLQTELLPMVDHQTIRQQTVPHQPLLRRRRPARPYRR